jgi:pSer/pThr/pTyr-binding forkhead associated (FHA) protein
VGRNAADALEQRAKLKRPSRRSDEWDGFLAMAMSDKRTTSFYLVYRIGDEPEQIVIWDTVDVRVGRRKSQDIVVSDAEVSREHAVFRRDGDRHTVKDLGTRLGTLVNGERISEYELQPGDLIQIGPLEVRFGCTSHRIQPRGDRRFASQLKGGLHVPARPGAGGRTVLGFDPAESYAPAAPTAPPPELNVARAVTLDGTLEEADDDGPLGLTNQEMFVGESAPGLPLDRGPEADSRRGLDRAPATSAAPESEATLGVVLEIEGQTPQLESLLATLRGKLIGTPPVKIRIEKPRSS